MDSGAAVYSPTLHDSQIPPASHDISVWENDIDPFVEHLFSTMLFEIRRPSGKVDATSIESYLQRYSDNFSIARCDLILSSYRKTIEDHTSDQRVEYNMYCQVSDLLSHCDVCGAFSGTFQMLLLDGDLSMMDIVGHHEREHGARCKRRQIFLAIFSCVPSAIERGLDGEPRKQGKAERVLEWLAETT